MSLTGEPSTVFVPLMEGLYDSDYGPHVYQGELSREQVLEIGRRLGDCYPRIAIAGSPDDGWFLSYHSEENGPPPEKIEGGESFVEIPGCGALRYSVEYCEIHP